MSDTGVSRRGLLAAALATGFVGKTARAEVIHDLKWSDLLPQGEAALPPGLQNLLPHDEAAMAAGQPPSSGVRTDWNGRVVRLSGFVLPLDQGAAGVTAFILVPFVGACIHVPPPPANQLVLVTTERPFQSEGLFEAVTVIGMFGTAATSTQLAEIGYALSADRIERYRW